MQLRTSLLLFFCISLAGFSQERNVDRITVSGIIKISGNDDLEGINIYNTSSQKGTITAEDGSFRIQVATNDRVRITALQFQSFTVIVDNGIVESKKMTVYLNPAVNQLDEVIVRPYDLSGNVKADVGKIKTVTLDQSLSMSYTDLEFNYGFTDDYQTSIRGNFAEDAFYNNQQRIGGNVLGLIGLLIPKADKKARTEKQSIEAISVGLRQRFSNTYLNETFGIAEGKEIDFLFYAQDNGLDPILLGSNNEMRLLKFIYQKAEDYNTVND